MLQVLVFYLERPAIASLKSCRICFRLYIKAAVMNMQKIQLLDFRNVGFEQHFKSTQQCKNCSHQTAEIKGLRNNPV